MTGSTQNCPLHLLTSAPDITTSRWHCYYPRWITLELFLVSDILQEPDICTGDLARTSQVMSFAKMWQHIPQLTHDASGCKKLQHNKVTHVKSCSMTRAGLNGISTDMSRVRDQSRMFSMSFLCTWNSSQFRTADSNKMRTEYGSLSEMAKKQHWFDTVHTVSQKRILTFLAVTRANLSNFHNF